MIKSVLAVFAALALILLAGCATQPQQVACRVPNGPTIQVTEAECAQLLASQQRPATQPQTTTAAVPGPLVFSNEGSGSGPCRLRAGNGIRLKKNPTALLRPGTVIAVEKEDGSGAAVFSRHQNEDCTAWRRRAAQDLVFKG